MKTFSVNSGSKHSFFLKIIGQILLFLLMKIWVQSLTKVCQIRLKNNKMRKVKPLSEYQKDIYGEILGEFFNPIFSTLIINAL
jgi:hypothetical protein